MIVCGILNPLDIVVIHDKIVEIVYINNAKMEITLICFATFRDSGL